MLKLEKVTALSDDERAAAFGRLCVETNYIKLAMAGTCAAAFGRLCVETLDLKAQEFSWLAAAFGRLCVETLLHRLLAINHLGNRLQAVLRCNKTQ